MPKSKKIKAWSYSRYNLYKQCPLKFKLQNIDKIPQPPSAPMARGAAIHDLAEKYTKGLIARIPKELKLFAADFKIFRAKFKKKLRAMVVEDNWAFTKNWDQTTWDDWANCWVRIKLDLAYEIRDGILIIRDWKTGKYRPDNVEDYLEQLSLYALAALVLHPYLTEVRPQLAYLDLGIVYAGGDRTYRVDEEIPDDDCLIYEPSDIDKLKKAWAKRIKPMMNDMKFAPRPNRFCNWCHYRHSNKKNGGGQCKY